MKLKMVSDKGICINPFTTIYTKDIKRFWSKVALSEGCWLWKGGRSANGYGLFHVDQELIGAHRFSFILANGKIPIGADVCHLCDNPRCVRPDHLEAGSRSDNMYHYNRKRS